MTVIAESRLPFSLREIHESLGTVAEQLKSAPEDRVPLAQARSLSETLGTLGDALRTDSQNLFRRDEFKPSPANPGSTPEALLDGAGFSVQQLAEKIGAPSSNVSAAQLADIIESNRAMVRTAAGRLDAESPQWWKTE